MGWVVCRPQLMVNALRVAKPCQGCTLLARPLEAFTETIVLVETLFSIAWSSVAWLAAQHQSTCSARTANSGCTHLTPRISSFHKTSRKPCNAIWHGWSSCNAFAH